MNVNAVNPASAADDDVLLAGLNPQQLAAVTSDAQALLVIAGAGSGKTSVLTRRIAYLLREGRAWPSQILAITFTNKAAREMRERVQTLLGQSEPGMWISTFHSACVRILRADAEALNYPKGFTIYDAGDSRALLRTLVKETGAESYGFKPNSVAAQISKLKNDFIGPDEFSGGPSRKDPKQRILAEVYELYERRLRAARAFDFDDLLTQTVRLFREHPHIADRYRRRFRHILVDEYQDTNKAQYLLIRELTKPVDSVRQVTDMSGQQQRNECGPAAITVVGDSDQSIYAFRGADMRNIIDFERDFPNATVVKLEQNYRSTQNILNTANALIANNFDRQEKNLWSALGDGQPIQAFTGFSQHDEARYVVQTIERLHAAGERLSSFAVFYRVNAQTRALEETLVRAGLAYRVYGGTKFYDRQEVRDALAYLSSIANPEDPVAWQRLVAAPKRGVGEAMQAKLVSYAREKRVNLHEAMLHPEDAGVMARVRPVLKKLGKQLQDWRSRAIPDGENAPAPASQILQEVIDQTGLYASLATSPDAKEQARAENLVEFVAVAKDFDKNNPGAGLLEFLTEVSLVAWADEVEDESGAISLMTLHTAKGLEFDNVFLTGLEDGLLPHRMSFAEPGGLAEERRLMYVGITRAKRRLHLSLAASRASYGEIAAATPSRFLAELPAQLLDWQGIDGDALPMRGDAAALNGDGNGRGTGYLADASAGSGSSGSQAASSPTGAAGGSLAAWREKKKQKNVFVNDISGLAGQKTAAGQYTGTGVAGETSADTFKPGERVSHASYGRGIIEQIAGEGSKSYAVVRFNSGRMARIMLGFNLLKRIQP